MAARAASARKTDAPPAGIGHNNPPLDPKVVKQWADRAWRLDNLYTVQTEEGEVIPFVMNDEQRQFLSEAHGFDIILKARQLGFCLDPSTRVLTAELRWKRIDQLRVGEEIVSVDEHPPGGKGSARKMRTGVVQGVVEVRRKAYRITFDDGRTVVCTGQHPWLSRKVATDAKWRSIEPGNPNSVGLLTVGTKVRSITIPWGEPSADDGWFGGMLDGEGSMSKTNVAASINVSQREGAVWNRLVGYAAERGYHPRIESDKPERLSKHGKAPVPKLAFGRMDEMFRLIGQTRPTRFIDCRFWEGRELPGKRNADANAWVKITKIEPLGMRKLIDLQTSTGTYIAEGLVSHNTTFVAILMLDACLFNSNTMCGIIADTLPNAQKIFEYKIKAVYDRLPAELKSRRTTTTDRAQELKFNNGSAIWVGTSHRGGTLQWLHISEYGKICAKYPGKAKEIRTGALNTVHAGQTAIIESTAEGNDGHFFEMSQRADAKLKSGTALSALDFKLHFFPWWRRVSYRLPPGSAIISPALAEYFEKLRLKGIELDDGQKAWYAKKLEDQDKEMAREFPSTPDEPFFTATEGAYYTSQLDAARVAGRIGVVAHEPALPVYTCWDLGLDDYMACWYFQVFNREVRWIRYEEWQDKSLAECVAETQKHGYVLRKMAMPHDIRVRDLVNNEKRLTFLENAGYDVVIAPSGAGSLAEGISTVRMQFNRYWFDETNCADGLKRLGGYRKKWDHINGQWLSQPAKDGNDHGADALRTGAVVMEEFSAVAKKPLPAGGGGGSFWSS